MPRPCARAGLATIVLEPKDGLALISANGVSIGQAAIVAEHAAARRARRRPRARGLARGDARATPRSSTRPSLAAKPVPGQLAAGADIRGVPRRQRAVRRPAVPRRSRIRCRSGWARRSTGPSASSSAILGGAVAIELNAMDDNPLVDVDVRADAQQRQLPPHGARARPRRAPAGHRARRAAVRPAHEPPLVVDRRAVHGRVHRATSSSRAAGLLALRGRDAEQPSSGSPRSRRRSTSAPLDLGVEDHATNAVADGAAERGSPRPARRTSSRSSC